MIDRALIVGASGQLGTEVRRSAPAGVELTALDLPDFDVRDASAVTRAIEQLPSRVGAGGAVVFNCAAYTNVDGAESARDAAMAINAVAPGVLAGACAKFGARLLHVSTDYVFDGKACTPYQTDAATAPLNVYGESKLEGERRVLAENRAAVIVRTAWLHSGVGANFVRTAVRVLTSGSVMRVVDDQIGTPTRARHLAEALWRLADQPLAGGVFHFTDSGTASWFDVAMTVAETLRAANRLPEGAAVEPITSRDWRFVARRPSYSVLDKHDSWRVIGVLPPQWREGVIASTHEILNA